MKKVTWNTVKVDVNEKNAHNRIIAVKKDERYYIQ